jgi:rhamnosyltransferase
MKKSIDIIIPVYRPDHTLVQLLKGLKVQTYPINQIIIMNTERQFWDTAYEVLVPSITVTHLPKSAFDHGGTRDQAARMSGADIMLFMTQDAIPSDNRVIEELVRMLEIPNIKAAYARQLPLTDCNIVERYTRSFNYPSQSRIKGKEDLGKLGIKTYFCSNVCTAYDRETYLELGGFESHTIFNEDMIFAAHLIQAGYQVGYAAKARVLHSHNYTSLMQLKRNFDLAVSQADHPEIFAGIRSEGEGLRLVKQTAFHLIHRRKPWLLVPLVISSGCKYLGYCLGKHYKKLPSSWISRLTMNKSYWNFS